MDEKTRPNPGARHRSPSLRVLIVDDSRALRETLCEVLCGWEMHAEAAADAPSARAALARGRFDVALVDLVMPGLDGIELIRQLGPRHPETRFYLMTAYDECERALEAESRHGIRVLAKPVDLALLLKRLHAVAESRPLAAVEAD